MHWIWLVIAIICEVAWAVGMKLSVGFTKPVPSAFTAVTYVLSLVFLTLAAKKLDLSVAYGLWAGCGAACIAVVGMTLLKEPVSLLKVVSIGLIALGIAGLKWTSVSNATP
jgi:multidrug transporter EmrE-like cation transporter